MMNWNSYECLDSNRAGALIQTSDCHLEGKSRNQQFSLSSDNNQLMWQKGKQCIGPQAQERSSFIWSTVMRKGD